MEPWARPRWPAPRPCSQTKGAREWPSRPPPEEEAPRRKAYASPPWREAKAAQRRPAWEEPSPTPPAQPPPPPPVWRSNGTAQSWKAKDVATESWRGGNKREQGYEQDRWEGGAAAGAPWRSKVGSRSQDWAADIGHKTNKDSPWASAGSRQGANGHAHDVGGAGSTPSQPSARAAGTLNSKWALLPLRTSNSEEDRIASQRKRRELDITVDGEADDSVVPPIEHFEELAGIIPDYAMAAIQELGIKAPMAIQAQALPLVLAGHDLIGIAKTGSGKTMAFLLPAIAHIESQPPLAPGGSTPVALVLAPVRELAVQIGEEASKLLTNSTMGKHASGVGVVCLFGGGSNCRWQQVEELQKGRPPYLVVATPGRVCDLLSSQELSLSRVSYFVLDEADRMLDSGFGDQMDTIAGGLRQDRQTLFFSATWPLEVQDLAGCMCNSPPIRVSVGQEDNGGGPTANSDIIQEILVFDGGPWDENEKVKQERLYGHLRQVLQNEEYKVLVFVNMKQLAWELAGKLNEEGFKADFMYGGRSQDSRYRVVQSFKTGEIKLLVTTDVMARGLDIPGISHVVVYDCYGGIDEYVHRIGRTARGPYGQGHSLTFFEYDPKFSDMPAELIAVLEQANQVVPPALQAIADEVASGERQAKYRRKW